MSHESDILETARAWDRAMITNDADAIGRYMADDWVIIGPDGSIGDKSGFLALVRSGALIHNEMTTENPRVRIYGETAVVVARGVSGGAWQGQPFRELERMSCVFVRSDGRWRCVLTHLSRFTAEG
jgi:ketosteroid isomerase-like protein